eukprot:4431687-Lingulodinium_polyedra.AAC.1
MVGWWPCSPSLAKLRGASRTTAKSASPPCWAALSTASCGARLGRRCTASGCLTSAAAFRAGERRTPRSTSLPCEPLRANGGSP